MDQTLEQKLNIVQPESGSRIELRSKRTSRLPGVTDVRRLAARSSRPRPAVSRASGGPHDTHQASSRPDAGCCPDRHRRCLGGDPMGCRVAGLPARAWRTLGSSLATYPSIGPGRSSPGGSTSTPMRRSCSTRPVRSQRRAGLSAAAPPSSGQYGERAKLAT